MAGILDHVSTGARRGRAFPYLVSTACLPEDNLVELMESAPPYEAYQEAFMRAARTSSAPSNVNFTISGKPLLADRSLPACWRAFFEYHLSPDFYRDVIRLMGDQIRLLYPFLEERLGKPLEEASVHWRGMPTTSDIQIDCQFAFDTPVTKVSRVRGPHIDKSLRLMSGLLYMREKTEVAEGGDLALYAWKGSRLFRRYEVADDALVEDVEIIDYRANTLVLFVNSLDSVHGVTPRNVTPRPRRYMNFIFEVREPLFDVSLYQQTDGARAEQVKEHVHG